MQTGYIDYGFRQLDVSLGRWFVVDALAESYFSESPYAYVNNNPINRYDVAGLLPMPMPHFYIGAVHTGTADLWGFLHNSDFVGTFDNAGGYSSGGGGDGHGASGHWGEAIERWEIETDWYIDGRYDGTTTTYEERPGKVWVVDGGRTYTVKKNDTVYGIVNRTFKKQFTMKQFYAANPQLNGNPLIKVGQVLNIPDPLEDYIELNEEIIKKNKELLK